MAHNNITKKIMEKKMTEEIKKAKKISKNEAIDLIKNAGINIAGKISFYRYQKQNKI